MSPDRSEPEVSPDRDFTETDAPVTRDPETGEQRYPEQVGGTDRTAPAPNETGDDEVEDTGSGR